MEPGIIIAQYTKADHAELLRLLLLLQSKHFSETASSQIQQVNRSPNIEKPYDEYISFIENHSEGNWNVLTAKTETERIVGFIIGSIETDDDLVLNPIGKLEDWLVETDFRGKGIGAKLYTTLEKWFIEKGCKQVRSDTWTGNTSSIKAHEELGFFVSGIQFGKKL